MHMRARKGPNLAPQADAVKRLASIGASARRGWALR